MTHSNLKKLAVAGALGATLAAGMSATLARADVDVVVPAPTTIYTEEYAPPPPPTTTYYYSTEPGVTVYYGTPTYVDHYYYEHHHHWWQHERD
jgi:hypothetical protein